MNGISLLHVLLGSTFLRKSVPTKNLVNRVLNHFNPLSNEIIFGCNINFVTTMNQ